MELTSRLTNVDEIILVSALVEQVKKQEEAARDMRMQMRMR